MRQQTLENEYLNTAKRNNKNGSQLIKISFVITRALIDNNDPEQLAMKIGSKIAIYLKKRRNDTR